MRKVTFIRVLTLLATLGAGLSAGDLIWPK
jgi:hypothetical protein